MNASTYRLLLVDSMRSAIAIASTYRRSWPADDPVAQAAREEWLERARDAARSIVIERWLAENESDDAELVPPRRR